MTNLEKELLTILIKQAHAIDTYQEKVLKTLGFSDGSRSPLMHIISEMHRPIDTLVYSKKDFSFEEELEYSKDLLNGNAKKNH
jgi:hypothetical protein